MRPSSWRRSGATSGLARARSSYYDYGTIIATILQTRQAPITALMYLNAGLYPELYRPRLVQRVTLTPILGPLVRRRFNEQRFHAGWAALFGAGHPLDPRVSREHRIALTHHDPGASAVPCSATSPVRGPRRGVDRDARLADAQALPMGDG